MDRAATHTSTDRRRRLPIANAEASRIEALASYAILDTPAEAEFDRIVNLAQVLFDMPTAVISLIDTDRQWFKARVGLDAEQTAREHSFCDHAIRGNDVFVVPDATLDERFLGNPLVTTAPHIRFYAGAPLRTPSGFNLGALCIISDRPRAEFTPKDRARLQVLAAIVVNEMELKMQAEKARRLAEEKEILVREVHHRIKNSLQLVNVVLQAQALRAESAITRQALEDAADRVVTIGTVHTQLYRSKSVKEAQAGTYLAALVAELQRAIAYEACGQSVELKVPPDLQLSADALPKIGLVVTELLTNAIRHGSGKITVTMRMDGKTVLVSAADEGPGFSSNFDLAAKRNNLGIYLVRRLAIPDGVWIDPEDRRRIFARMAA